MFYFYFHFLSLCLLNYFYSFPCEQVVSPGDSRALSVHTQSSVLCPIWFGRGPTLSVSRAARAPTSHRGGPTGGPRPSLCLTGKGPLLAEVGGLAAFVRLSRCEVKRHFAWHRPMSTGDKPPPPLLAGLEVLLSASCPDTNKGQSLRPT